MGNWQTKILNILRSPQFFAAALLLFFIESAWIAFSAAYPMVFDENTHFTVIQLYAHQWGPFLPAHLTATDAAGAIVRDPSFLYHYLLSFPYRLISAVTNDQMMQIIDLRFINIFLFGGGLILFRRLLLKTKVSPAIVNTVILFFVLVPIVPLLAGEINYDNLLMPIVALSLLMTIAINDVLGRGKLPITKSSLLLALCLAGSLVQVEFIPIFIAIVLWLGWRLVQAIKADQVHLKAQLQQAWPHSSRWRKTAAIVPLGLVLYLSLQMFGVNLLRYHTLTPSCGQVLTLQQCVSDANWTRTQYALAHPQRVDKDPVIFAASWTYRMFVDSFFTSSGGGSPKAYYLSINPLPLIFVVALAAFVSAAALFIRYQRSLFNGYRHLGFLLFVSLVYSVVLFLHNYHDFVRFDQKFAIQGRYIFPVILPIILILALGFRQLFQHRLHLKTALVIMMFLLFLQGGGALTYITVSNQNWYWQNRVVVRLNEAAQHLIKPLILVKTPIKSFGRLD